MASPFMQALLNIGIDRAIAEVVNGQFQKVEATESQVALLTQRVHLLEQGLNAAATQVADVREKSSGIELQVRMLQQRFRNSQTELIMNAKEYVDQVDFDSLQSHVRTLQAAITTAEASFQGVFADVAQLRSAQMNVSPYQHHATAQQAVPTAQSSTAHLPGQPSLPSGVKLTAPQAFAGITDDPTVLNTFLAQSELYFRVTGVTDARLQAHLGLTWLKGDAFIWWESVAASYPLDQLTWPTLRGLLEKQYRPVDAKRVARDQLAACVQGRLHISQYLSNFRRCVLRVPTITDEETLDRFLRGLHDTLKHHVLLQDPKTFEQAAILAERAAGVTQPFRPAFTQPPARTPAPGPVPMELGAAGGYTRPQQRQPSGRNSPGACWGCGQHGHRLAQCPRVRTHPGNHSQPPHLPRGTGTQAPYRGGRGGYRGSGVAGTRLNAFEGLDTGDLQPVEVHGGDQLPQSDIPVAPRPTGPVPPTGQ